MATPIGTQRVLRRLLTSGVHARADRLLERIHPADLGPLLSGLTSDEIRTVIDMLFKQRRAATTLRELPHELLPQVLEALSDERLAGVLSRLEIDDLLELVEHVPEERRESVRGLLPAEKLEELRKAELYPPSSAGRVMTTSYLALDEKMTAQGRINQDQQQHRLALISGSCDHASLNQVDLVIEAAKSAGAVEAVARRSNF